MQGVSDDLGNESVSQITIDDAVSPDDSQNLADSSKTIEINQENYEDYFNPRTGEILSDANILKGDTLKIGNISNRAFVIDRPLTLMPITPNDEISNGFIHLVKGSDGSTITNLTINNTKGTLTLMGVTVGQLHGIWLSNSNNNLIAYNTIRIANAGGVYAMPMGWSSNNRIIYNDMKTYVTSNIIMGECHYNLISHNRIEVLSYSDLSVTNLIYFNPFGHADYSGSPLCKGNIISYNYLKGFCTGAMSIILQCTYVNHDGTVIANNTIFKGSFGVNLNGRDICVYGNTVEGSAIGISVSGGNFAVHDNRVSGISQQTGISATANDDSTGIVFNNVVNYTDVAVAMSIGSNVDAFDNKVTIREYGVGISIYGNNSNVHENNVKNKHDAGFSILGNYNVVSDNIVNTKSVGVSIPAASTGKRYYNNTIVNNRITSESYGISIVGLVYNSVLRDNVIETNSTPGINLDITDRKSNTELDNMVNGVILNSTAIVVDDSNFNQYFDEYGYLTYEFPEGRSKVIIMTFLTNKNLFFDDKITVISNRMNNLLFNVTVTFTGDAEGSLIGDFNFINYDKESVVVDNVGDVSVNRNNITSIMRKGSLSNSAILLQGICEGVTISANNIYVNSKMRYAYAIDVPAVNPSNGRMNKRLASGLAVKDNTIIMISTDFAEAIYNDAVSDAEFANNRINIICDGDGYGIAFANVIGRISDVNVTENEIVIHSRQMAYLIELHNVDGSMVANNILYSDCNGSYAIGAFKSNNISITGNEITLFAGDLANVKYVSDALGKGNSPIALIKNCEEVYVGENLIYTNATNPISVIDCAYGSNIAVGLNSYIVDEDNYDVYFNNNGLLKAGIIESGCNIFIKDIDDARLMEINVPLNISSYGDSLSSVSLKLDEGASGSSLSGMNLVNSTITLSGASDVVISDCRFSSGNTSLLSIAGGCNNTFANNSVNINGKQMDAIVLNGTRANSIRDNIFMINGSDVDVIVNWASAYSYIHNNTFNATGGDLVFIHSVSSVSDNVTNNKLSANASYACTYLASDVHNGFVGYNDILINTTGNRADQSAISYYDSSSGNVVYANSIESYSADSNDYAVAIISEENLSNQVVKNYLISSNGLKKANSAVSAPFDYVDMNTPIDVYVSLDGDDVKGNGSITNPYATIVEAVAKSLNHAVIYVADGCYIGSDITVDKDLSIVAINPGSVLIDANSTQLFTITENGALLIDSVIIQNAYDEIGGSVFINNGNLRIVNSVICNSSSYHDNSNPVFDRDLVYDEGGLYQGHTQDYINTGLGGVILNRGNLLINSSLFYDNLGHWGGVIANYGKTAIDLSQFYNNRGVHGGVIYSNSKNELTIENSLFNNNTALASIDYCSLRIATVSWSIDTGNNHVIYSECGIPVGSGGVVYTQDTSISLKNSTFVSNHAKVGGVIATSADSFSSVSTSVPPVSLIIDDCLFVNNRANDTRHASGSIELGDFYYNREHHGGVVYGTFNKLHITDSEFYQNLAVNDGGVLYAKASDGKILDSRFMENTAGISGGALSISSNFIIMRTVISNNSARYGGAIEYTSPVYYGHIQDNLNIYNSTISHNRAINMGGAFSVGAGNITIRDSNIVDNLAPAYETIHTSGSSYSMDMRYNYWGTSENGYTGPDDSVWKVSNNLFRPWYKEWIHWEPETVVIDPVNPIEVDPENPNPNPYNPNVVVDPTSTGPSTSTGTSIGGNGNGAYSGNGDGNNMGPGDGNGNGNSLVSLPGQKEYGGQRIIGIYDPSSSNRDSRTHGTVDSDSMSNTNSSSYDESLQSIGMTSNAASLASSSAGGQGGSSSGGSSNAYEVTKNIDLELSEDNIANALIVIAIALILLFIGFKRKQKENDEDY